MRGLWTRFRRWVARRKLLLRTEAQLLASLGPVGGVPGLVLQYRTGIARWALYAYLDELEDRAMLWSEPEPRIDGRAGPRRIYWPTRKGQMTLAAWRDLGGVL